jgi:hypothetical protein
MRRVVRRRGASDRVGEFSHSVRVREPAKLALVQALRGFSELLRVNR